jgi:prepilin-type N-terminal cleavage/methylation domain-containing protein
MTYRFSIRSPASSTYRRSAGVTLIELLVVVLILSVILGVVGASLMSGIRVWDSARAFHDKQSPLAIGFDTMSKDIMNAPPCYAIPWQGTAAEIIMPTLVPGRSTGQESLPVAPPRLGRVRYYLDPASHELRRKVWAVPDAEPGFGEQLMTGIQRAAFEYRARSADGYGPWISTWSSETNQPVAVRMTLEVARGGGQPVTYQRVVVPWVGTTP